MGSSGTQRRRDRRADSIRDLRVAEATRFDVTIEDGKIADYRVRLDISFESEAGRLIAKRRIYSIASR